MAGQSPRGRDSRPLVYFSLHSVSFLPLPGSVEPGHSDTKTALCGWRHHRQQLDPVGDHKFRFPEGHFKDDSVLPGILAQYEEAYSWVSSLFPCDGWWDL